MVRTEAQDFEREYFPDDSSLYKGGHSVSKMVRYLDAIIGEVERAPVVHGDGYSWQKSETKIDTHKARLILVEPIPGRDCVHVPGAQANKCLKCGKMIAAVKWRVV